MSWVQAVFLDFDGIILESVEIKTLAFRRIFENYPPYADQIVSYHLANGGLPRFDKFRYIYQNILKEPLSNEKFEALCRQFSDLVTEQVIRCDFVGGAKLFLEKYHSVFPLFIISGTPQDEIVQIAHAKKIAHYFKGIFGSPPLKGYWTKKILSDYHFDSQRVFWVGDALSDWQAAQEFGIKFVARTIPGQNTFLNKNVYSRIKDLFDLDAFLTKIEAHQEQKIK